MTTRILSFVKQSTMTSQSNPGYQTDAVRYTSPSRIQQLNRQVDEVTDVMKDNIRLELERGGKLDDLQSKSDILNEHSRQFEVRSKKIKNKYWWKNVKMWIILILTVVIIITIIVVVVVVKTKK